MIIIKSRCGECAGCQMLSGAGCGNCAFCKSGECFSVTFSGAFFNLFSCRRSTQSKPLPCEAVHETCSDPASRLDGLPGQRWIGRGRGDQEEKGEMWGMWGLQGGRLLVKLTQMSKYPFSVLLMSFDKVEDCGNCDNCVKRKLGETMRSNQVTISTLYYWYTSWKTISWQLVDNQVTISLSKSRHWSTICWQLVDKW